MPFPPRESAIFCSRDEILSETRYLASIYYGSKPFSCYFLRVIHFLKVLSNFGDNEWRGNVAVGCGCGSTSHNYGHLSRSVSHHENSSGWRGIAAVTALTLVMSSE